MDLNERISKARTRLAAKVPFFGTLLLHATILVCDKVPTASVSPRGVIRIGPDFAARLDDPELAGVLCHEILHPGLGFWARKGGRNHALWNIAHDLSFNPDIVKMGGRHVKLPEGVLYEEEFIGLSAEEIYERIQDRVIEIDADHLDALEHASDPGEDSKWKIILIKAAKAHRDSGRGDLPEGIQRVVDSILHPAVDWKTQLARWVADKGAREDVSYSRPGRRSSSSNGILPSMTRNKPDVAVLWDTSGSMDGHTQRAFSEICAILEETHNVRLIACDADVHADTDVETPEEVAEMAVGGGGSDFRPAFDKLRGYRGLVVAVTDGDIAVPAHQPHGLTGVLWALVGEGASPPASWGMPLQILQ